MAQRQGIERYVVPAVLLVLLAASVSLLVLAVFLCGDLEASLVESEVGTRTAAVRLRLRRRHSGVTLRGELISSPATSADVRSMVAFCTTAGGGSVAALRDVALHDTDTLAAANAVRALGRLGHGALDPAVAALVRDSRVRVRDEAILALGESGAESALDALEPLLSDADEHVRALAIRAVGRIGGERAQRLLADMSSSVGTTRLTAAFVRDAQRTER